MFNTIITTVKTLLRRPSTWVWGALFPIALSTMFMFMFVNLSSDGTVDPVPVAVVADETWDASTFKDVGDVACQGRRRPAARDPRVRRRSRCEPCA